MAKKDDKTNVMRLLEQKKIAYEPVDFEEFEITLEPGEKLLVYTKGALCANASKPGFGLERLRKSFKAAHAIDQVVADIKSFAGTEHLEDDIILLWLERQEKEGTEAC